MASRKWLAALGVVLVGLSAPARSRAVETSSELDGLTYATFSRSVALPGLSLNAGTYLFELADPIGAWGLVRVSSRDRRVVYLTTFTRVVDRPRGLNPAQTFSFGEAAANSAPPIKAWWVTGQTTGREFIYE